MRKIDLMLSHVFFIFFLLNTTSQSKRSLRFVRESVSVTLFVHQSFQVYLSNVYRVNLVIFSGLLTNMHNAAFHI